MRLVTRSDFDGLACAVLLQAAGLIDEYKFAHPKDLQDGMVEVTEKDILANVPYVPGCGLWFDHHSSEKERLDKNIKYEGLSKEAPSCARVIWDYYGGYKTFSESFDEMMAAVDKVDSGMLTIDDIRNPQGWVLLGFIMDPRTGLGRYRDYRISNYRLMLDMVEYCSTMTADKILRQPDVKERTDRYFAQEQMFKEMVKKNSVLDGNLLIVDLRGEEEIYSGNRFTIYGMYPQCNISMQVMWGLKKQNTVFTVGHSIINRTSDVDVGSLMLVYGGGGHSRVGTCQVANKDADMVFKTLSEALKD